MVNANVSNSSTSPAAGAYVAEYDDGISLLDLLTVIAENLRLLVLLPLAVGLVALAITFVIPPTFTASSKFLPPQQQQSAAASMLQSLGALGGLAGAASGLKNPADQYVAFLKTRAVQDALLKRFDLKTRYEADYDQDARKGLEERTRATVGKDNIITVEVDDHDPAFAAQLANAYVEELGLLMNRLAVTEAQQRRVFFERQLQQAKVNLVKAEQALGSSGVGRAVLNTTPSTAVEGLARLRAQVTGAEVRIASMRSYLTDTAPELRQAINELAALRSQVVKAEREQPSQSGNGNDYIAKFREFKYQETLFELFARQYEVARIDESREGAVIQTIDVAQVPEKKSKPKRAIVAVIATVAAGFLLLIFIFFRSGLRRAAGDAESAAKLNHLGNAFRRAVGRRASA